MGDTMTDGSEALHKEIKKRRIEFQPYFGIGIGFKFEGFGSRYDWYHFLLPFVVVSIIVDKK